MNRDTEDKMMNLALAINDCLEEFDVDVLTFALVVKIYCDNHQIDVESFSKVIIKTEQMRKMMFGKYRIDLDEFGGSI